MISEIVQADDAAAALLGAAMLGVPDLDDLLEMVGSGDFYRPWYGEVWAAIGRVHQAGTKPDLVSVRASLDVAKVRYDPVQLIDLAQSTPFVGEGAYYAEQVVQAAGLRAIQQAGQRLVQLGASPGDLEERREEARKVVDLAVASRRRSRARTIADLLPQVIDRADQGQTDVLATGYDDLDRLIRGLAPGRLVVVGARPGVGKSLMGTNLALHFAGVHQHAVLISSLEMPELEVGQRLMAAHAQVNLTNLQVGGGTVDERTWQRIADKAAELSAMPITIDDSPGQTVTSIRRAARDIQRNRDDLALIVVDYLQLVRPSDPKVNRSEQIGEISRGLKLLARETGACVVAMAQVNREGARQGNIGPRMSDLRESGSIEADADQVILMHQPNEETAELELIVDKNRHGPRGVARLHIQGHYARLVDLTQWAA
jgi:replicative DNA helicase